MSDIQETVKLLTNTWEHASKELFLVNGELARNTARKARLIQDLDTILKTLNLLKHQFPKAQMPDLLPPPELRFRLGEDATIGDFMEKIIEEKGRAMTQREIIDTLTEMRIPISKKNPHVVIANIVKKDAKGRFEKDEIGRIKVLTREEHATRRLARTVKSIGELRDAVRKGKK